jgi:hypothetical protein
MKAAATSVSSSSSRREKSKGSARANGLAETANLRHTKGSGKSDLAAISLVSLQGLGEIK